MTERPSLDKIADRLSVAPMRWQALVPRSDPLPQGAGGLAILRFAGGFFARMVGALRGLPNYEETVRQYCSVVGVDRKRALADIAAISARLNLLGFVGDPPTLEVAHWLTAWAADGRPDRGAAHAAVETKGAELRVKYNSYRKLRTDTERVVAAKELEAMTAEYVQAWDALLAADR